MNDVKSCLLVGVGGQGAILISKIMSNGFMKAGYDVKQSEVHGMAQRGGSVSTQVRWGKKVYGPVFGKGEADIMVALEKMEAVRYAEFLNPNGVAVINDYAIKSTTIASGAEAYPEGCIEAMQKNFKTIAVPASDIAIELIPFFSISSSPSINPSTRLSSCPRRMRSTVFTMLRIGPVTSRIKRQPKISAIPIQNSIITLEIKISLYCCKRTDLRSSSSAIYPSIF